MTASSADRVEELTGYRPETVIVQEDEAHLFYETLALSRREVQREIIQMVLAAHKVWPAPTSIVVSVMRRARAGGSVCRVGSLPFHNEIVTVRASAANVEEYGTSDVQTLWELCVFTRWIFHDTSHRDLRFLRYPYLLRDGGTRE